MFYICSTPPSTGYRSELLEDRMLIYRRTSLLESTAQTLVNTVNTVGVMGKGLAQAFKKREPGMFAAYERICERGLLEPGKLWLWRGEKGWVLNFPTKVHWRNPSKIEWIEAGLEKFVSAFEEQGINEVSFPLLGCGNGGLDWADVKPVMERYLSSLPIPVYIHDYTVEIGLPEHLEALAQQVREEKKDISFGGFMRDMRRIVDLSGSRLIELDTKVPFQASMTADDELAITTEDAVWQFQPDDLRGVWFGLQAGVVTKDKAGWAAKGGGKPLISMLSLLPGVRPIEIQRKGAPDPELAVELLPSVRRFAKAKQTEKQRELEWH